MSGTSIALIMGVVMLGFMALRIQVGVTMFLTGAIGYVWLSGLDPFLAFLKNAPYGRFSLYDLSVVPLFLLMGQFATHGGLSRSLFRAGNAFIGHWRGGWRWRGQPRVPVLARSADRRWRQLRPWPTWCFPS